MFLVFIFIILLHFTKSEYCLIKDSSYSTYLDIVNCSKHSYCCDQGCCTDAWYTWPLGILVMVLLLCCITCVKAWWDVYRNRSTDGIRVRYRVTNSSHNSEGEGPPPAYHVAIYFPQPQATNRIPSYEEVMGR